jgi:hypothetical protein
MSNPNGPFSYDDSTYAAVFWNRFTRVESGCMEWQGCRTPSGYGQLTRKGKRRLAHREAWSLTNGPIPEGKCVMHACDNRSCGNPEHLRLGDVADNLADMRAKGRHSHGPLHGALTSAGKRSHG